MKKQTNVGVVGCGYWGPNLIRNFNGLSDCNMKNAAAAPMIAIPKMISQPHSMMFSSKCSQTLKRTRSPKPDRQS